MEEKEQLYSRLLKFPPFFTLQDHQETRKKQLTYWSEITHSHFKRNKILESSLSELNSEKFRLFQDNSTGIVSKMHGWLVYE